MIHDDQAQTTGGAVSIPVLDNDVDVDGNLDPSSLRLLIAPAHGVAEVTATSITYQASAGFTGDDTLLYEVCDTAASCGTGQVEIAVTPPPPAPASPEPAPPAAQESEAPAEAPPPAAGEASLPDPSVETTLRAAVGGKLAPLTGAVAGATTFRVVGGAMPVGLSLLPDGTWHGALPAAGVWSVQVEACDAQSPPECSVFTLVLVSEELPRTGMEAGGLASAGLAALLAGLALLLFGSAAMRRQVRRGGLEGS